MSDHGRRSLLRIAAIGASLVLLTGVLVPTAALARSSSAASQATLKIHKVGIAHLPSAGAATTAPSGDIALEARPHAQQDIDAETSGSRSSAHVPSAQVPRPATLPVESASSGIAGLDHFDTRTAGTGSYANTQFSLEPPDQGMCVSNNGTVVEAVNTVVQAFDSSGPISDPVALNQFFNLAPEIDRVNHLYGDFTSDPKCYWDPDSGQWFLSLLQIDVNPSTGAFLAHAHQLLAVSETTDPTGAWYLYEWETTNDGSGGTPTHPNCPCFGDQPLLGADANGIYITTNEYPIFVAGFNGANIYALSKSALESGSLPPVFLFSEPTLAEGEAYSIQPSVTAPGAAYASANGGTEYFLSALEFTGGTDNRVALWAMTNTGNLNTDTSPVMAAPAIVNGVTYGFPPTVLQKDGPTPLMDLLNDAPYAEAVGLIARPVHEHLSPLNSNDDRMNQTSWDGTDIWGAVNTVVKSPNGASRVGIAYFAVAPGWDGDTLTASMDASGYVAVANNSVMFPSVAANKNGDAAIVFTLAGPNYYPSAAYVTLSASSAPSSIKVAKAGDGPADGFTGYRSQDPADGGVERWGDYSAAVADASGAIWMATETINQACDLNEFLSTSYTCGNTRTIYANWGTWISSVTP
jgi:hypothetical protein